MCRAALHSAITRETSVEIMISAHRGRSGASTLLRGEAARRTQPMAIIRSIGSRARSISAGSRRSSGARLRMHQ